MKLKLASYGLLVCLSNHYTTLGIGSVYIYMYLPAPVHAECGTKSIS